LIGILPQNKRPELFLDHGWGMVVQQGLVGEECPAAPVFLASFKLPTNRGAQIAG
jgi:hypothetical protein